eukprot:TRINITY_DN5029_c0_g1_i1.p1 TRINITY_DN5029_c0_g1~~TRINITY_DN5029_c0_g1_i1.p1  ORF type:complete len:377 (-),score=107.87 TRINITY_DN5029_c0_g1_i1:297-1427(-)
MAARVVYILCLTAVIMATMLVVVMVRQREVVEEEIGFEFDLESDFSYKYFDMMEKERMRDVSTFESRRSLLNDVCEKYKDPFRPENRALYHTHPPMNHFSFFRYKSQSNMMCSILKGGSNSWTIFMQRVDEEMRKNPVASSEKVNSKDEPEKVKESCWPECALASTKIVQVRHPLERLLSAYRYVFERTSTYEDQFVQVVSLKQVLGDKFNKLTWPQFVDMVIRNKLASHQELVELGKASGKIGMDGKVANVHEFIAEEASKQNHNINEPDIWVANHWAPYWFTCGLCLPELRPSYILHMDHLEKEVPNLLEELGMGQMNVTYPHALQGKEGHTRSKNKEYYSRLTKAQVWQLYNLYRVDHELFGFSPREFLDWAS